MASRERIDEVNEVNDILVERSLTGEDYGEDVSVLSVWGECCDV